MEIFREAGLPPGVFNYLSGSGREVGEALVECQVCGNVDTTDPCGICADPRRDGKGLCVVEDVADLWALDRAKLFTGK